VGVVLLLAALVGWLALRGRGVRSGAAQAVGNPSPASSPLQVGPVAPPPLRKASPKTALAPPLLRLLGPEDLVLEPGRITTVTIRLAERTAQPQVELRAGGLPHGVSVTAGPLRDGTLWSCQVVAGAEAIATDRLARLVAVCGEVRAAVPWRITVGSLRREITNSLGMKLVLIPAGRFRMGSPTTESGRGAADEDDHEVEITRPFYLGACEVTQEQYRRVMGSNPSRFAADNRPVEQVSWAEAVEFCAKLSELEKDRRHAYRLPAEAEWEHACRAGTTTPTFFGDSLSGKQANFDASVPYGGAEKGTSLGRTEKVRSYPPNRFGLYDMHGNVWEWCSDWYAPYGGTARREPGGPATGAFRVLRGGSWSTPGWQCRSACRRGLKPDDRAEDVGFRVVLVTGPRP
jgi:formylglycine-generating enzyme required for sulfatase activity